MGNQEMRKELAGLSFTEKVEILERLRDRSLAMAAAGPRHGTGEMAGKFEDTQRFCSCSDWEPCGCGNQPPYHCMWCCLNLTAEQIATAKQRGFYAKETR